MKNTKLVGKDKAWKTARERREAMKRHNAVMEPTGAVAEPIGAKDVDTGPSMPLPEPAPTPNVVMAGAVQIGNTHRVTMAVTTPSPGPNFLMLGITEARLLAKSLMEWAQYAEDRNNGKAP